MKKRWATFLAVAMLAGALVAPGAASASTTQAIANTGGMTIGVVGSPLAVTVSVDEIGHLTEVTVGGVVAEGDGHKVRFASEDDSTRVAVQAKNHKLTADIKAADLAAILGSHVWAAPLFGSDTDTEVTFKVVENGSGHPELADVAVTSDADFVVGDVGNEVEDDEAESSVKVTFTSNGYTMTLKIKVSMDLDNDDDDDDDSSVKLKIELRGKDVQKLRRQALDALVGAHVWDGRLCDGTPVGVGYTISEDGDISVDRVTVDGVDTDGHEVKTMPHGFIVNYDDSKAKVTVELKEKEDGTWDLKVRSKTTDKCHHDDDDDGGGDDDDDDEKEHGRRDKDKKDKKEKDDDDDDDDDDDEKDDD
jgi:hypothetical protein